MRIANSISFLLFAHVALAQNQDVVGNHIKSISSCTYAYDTMYPESYTVMDSSYVTYSRTGKATRGYFEDSYEPECGTSIVVCYYDKNGREIRCESEGAAGKYVTYYQYNQQGELTSESSFTMGENGKKEPYISTKFIFGSDGFLRYEIRIYENLPPDTIHSYDYYNGRMTHHQTDAYDTRYYYNRYDSLDYEEVKYRDGEFNKTVYERDSLGRVKKKYEYENAVLQSYISFTRDSSDKVLRTEEVSIKYRHTWIAEYNRAGNLIKHTCDGFVMEENVYDTSGHLLVKRLSGLEDGLYAEIKYTYNTHGDLVLRESYFGNGMLSERTTYVIQYFGK